MKVFHVSLASHKASGFLLILSFSALLGCEKDQPLSKFDEILGRYVVNTYVVGNDTIIDKKSGILKDSIEKFTVEIANTNVDSTFEFTYHMTKNGIESSANWGNSNIKKEGSIYYITNPFNTIDKNGGIIEGSRLLSRSASLDSDHEGVQITILDAQKED